MNHTSLDLIPVELQYIIAKGCGLDYTSVFNLLMVLPGLKTYVESYQHLKQELNTGFLEAKEKHKDGYKVCYFVKGGVRTAEYKRWNDKGVLIKHSHYKNNKLDGEFKWWHDNGHLHTRCFYKKVRWYGRTESCFLVFKQEISQDQYYIRVQNQRIHWDRLNHQCHNELMRLDHTLLEWAVYVFQCLGFE